MIFQNQKVDGLIGNTKWTLRSYGCLVASMATILEVDIHAIAEHAEYFNSDGLLTNPQKVCDDFSGEWNPDRSDIGLRPVIVETRFDGKLHFVVWTGDRFYDPLSTNGNPLRDYKIISFRNVKKRGEMNHNLTPDEARIIYRNALLREPENDDMLQGRNFDEMMGGVKTELDIRFTDRDKQITELNVAKERLIQGSIQKQAMINTITEKNTELEDANETCHDLVGEADNEKEKALNKRDEALNKLDMCNILLERCKAGSHGPVVPSKWVLAWGRFIDWIKKLIKKARKK